MDVHANAAPSLWRPPQDDRLDGVDVACDGERVATALGLPSDACPVPVYVRYKPGVSLAVAFRAGDEWFHTRAMRREAFADAARKARARIESWKLPAGAPVQMARLPKSVLAMRFPADDGVVGLRVVAAPKRIQRLVYAHVPEWDEATWRVSDRRLRIDVVRFKPARRAVVRVSTRAVHRSDGARRDVCLFARFYGGADRARQCHEIANAVADALVRRAPGDVRVGSPRSYAWVQEYDMTLMEAAAGMHAPESPASDGTAESVGTSGPSVHRMDVRELSRRAADVLGALTRVDPGVGRQTTYDSVLDELDAQAETLAALVPDVGPRARACVEALRASTPPAPPRLAFVHGDFGPEQLLVDGERTVVLDFDRAHAGDASEDAGAWCAWLEIERPRREGEHGEPPGARHPDAKHRAAKENDARDDARSAFLAQLASRGIPVDEDRIRWWTVVALMRRAVQPFRTCRPDWRRAVARYVARAEERLTCP